MFASHNEVKFFIPQIGFLLAAYLTIRFRQQISTWFMQFPVSNGVLLFLLSSLPFMLFEENINCFPPEAGGCKLFPITLPFLLIELLILLFIVRKFNLRRFWPIITVYAVLGVLWEIFIGVSTAEFLALPPIWFVIIFAWTWLSYVILAVVPLTIELKGRE